MYKDQRKRREQDEEEELFGKREFRGKYGNTEANKKGDYFYRDFDKEETWEHIDPGKYPDR